METNKQLTDEQIEKLQKQNEYLKKRVSVLKKCTDNLMKERRDLNTQLRAEKRVNDELKKIFFCLEPYTSTYSLSVLLNWVNEVALNNEKLIEEIESLYPSKSTETKTPTLFIYNN